MDFSCIDRLPGALDGDLKGKNEPREAVAKEQKYRADHRRAREHRAVVGAEYKACDVRHDKPDPADDARDRHAKRANEGRNEDDENFNPRRVYAQTFCLLFAKA